MLSRKTPARTTEASMQRRVCVITGANSGVGYETAKRVARAGAHVVMVCRNEDRGLPAKREIERLAGGAVDLVCGDLSEMASVRAIANTLRERYPQIHILINNAGVHSTTRSLTRDGYETTFAVNHLAPFLLTLLLLDRIKASAPARIINVSSQGHRFGGLDLNDLHWDRRYYRGLKAYGAAKTANLFFTWELADILRGTGVTVNAVHPGEVKTAIGRDNGRLWQAFHQHVVQRFLLGDAALSGEALYYHAASPELEHVTGRFFNMTLPEKPHAHALPKHRALAKTLWLLSERLTGLAVPERPVVAPSQAQGNARRLVSGQA